MSVNTSTCSQMTFAWSEKQLTVSQLIEYYQHLMPFPILITSGQFVSHLSDWSASKDDVYWAHRTVEQHWIIVSDKKGDKYRIPERYDAMVIPIMANGKEGAPFPFSNVREHGEYRFIKFVENKQMVFTDVKDKGRLHELGELSVIDVYDDVFVTVHSLRMEYLLEEVKTGKNDASKQQTHIISPEFWFLPSNAPVTVSLGVALARAPDIIYFHTMAELKALVDSYPDKYCENLKQYQISGIQLECHNVREDDYEYVDIEAEKQQKSLETAGTARQLPQFRKEPVALNKDVDPVKQLKELHTFYSTGSLVSEISNVDAEGYLQPVTWLASRENDVIACEKDKEEKEDTTDKGDVDQNDHITKSVSWLRKRFEESAQTSAKAEVKQPKLAIVSPTVRAETNPFQQNFASSSKQNFPLPSKQSSADLFKQRYAQSSKPSSVVTSHQNSALTSKHSYAQSAKQTIIPPFERGTALFSSTSGQPLHLTKHVLTAGSAVTSSPNQIPGMHDAGWRNNNDDNKSKNKLRDLPRDISGLSVEQVMDCLQLLGLDAYVPAMRAGQVDGQLLLCLKEEHLINNFGFTDFEATKLIQFAKYGWRPKHIQ